MSATSVSMTVTPLLPPEVPGALPREAPSGPRLTPRSLFLLLCREVVRSGPVGKGENRLLGRLSRKLQLGSGESRRLFLRSVADLKKGRLTRRAGFDCDRVIEKAQRLAMHDGEVDGEERQLLDLIGQLLRVRALPTNRQSAVDADRMRVVPTDMQAAVPELVEAHTEDPDTEAIPELAQAPAQAGPADGEVSQAVPVDSLAGEQPFADTLSPRLRPLPSPRAPASSQEAQVMALFVQGAVSAFGSLAVPLLLWFGAGISLAGPWMLLVTLAVFAGSGQMILALSQWSELS